MVRWLRTIFWLFMCNPIEEFLHVDTFELWASNIRVVAFVNGDCLRGNFLTRKLERNYNSLSPSTIVNCRTLNRMFKSFDEMSKLEILAKSYFRHVSEVPVHAWVGCRDFSQSNYLVNGQESGHYFIGAFVVHEIIWQDTVNPLNTHRAPIHAESSNIGR